MPETPVASRDRRDRGVDHAVALGRRLDLAVAVAQHDGGRRGRLRAAAHVEAHDRVLVHHAGAELLGHDRLEVGLGDLDLAVGELLEPHERLVQRVALQVQTHLLQRVGERVPPGVLAQDDLGRFLADRRRRP